MRKRVKHLGLLFITLLCCSAIFAQTIRGRVTDSAGVAVAYASVNLKNGGSNAIISFAVTAGNGAYALHLPAGLNPASLMIEVRCIGFNAQTKAVRQFSDSVNFILTQAVDQLRTVIVKNSRPVLRTSGDTLSYRVSDFSGVQDRVIGDVIKRLPGIAVATDGTISYNGKTISNLYIGGDNLLDDKYNIATGTIPQGVVDQVQVIENHQPIKMLQNKVMSDDVALNLTFKKDAKLQLVGQESVGVGLPGNYDVDLNAMMFKDKYKAINYIKGNNTGMDVQNDLLSHNLSSYLDRLNNDKPATVLSLGTAGTPDLAENRYLFDQSGMLSLNNLVNFKKGEQLKINLAYVHDRQREEYSQQTEVFLPGNTVQYNETENNIFRPDILHSQLTLNINKDRHYLNDALITDFSHKLYYSALTANNVPVNQHFLDNTLDFSNEFNLMVPAGSKNIIELYSYTEHVSEPENRSIQPNFNPDIFNDDKGYSQLIQTVNVPTWFTNNYFSFKIPADYITQSYRAGFVVQSQKLTSDLNVTQHNNLSDPESDSSSNRLNWLRKKAFVEADYDLPGKILKANLVLPVSIQQIGYTDNLYALDEQLTRFYFNPQFRAKYQVSTENFVSLSYRYRNTSGNIQDVYHGYILKDYRTLYANNAGLSEQKEQTATAGFNYRKALTLFFFSLNISYDQINANSITSSIITGSFQQRVVLPYQNTTSAWTTGGSVSKYSFALRTTFSGGVLLQTSRSNEIQNNIFLPYNTITTNYNASAEIKVSDQISLNYKANLVQTSSHSLSGAPAYHFTALVQQGGINYNLEEDLLFKLSGEYYMTYQSQSNPLKYFFADASAKFRLRKFKTDVELSGVNLLNVKNYHALSLAANTFTASSFMLPGRIVLLKLFFNI
jgi:Carboxypeptidase regulatory-like domain